MGRRRVALTYAGVAAALAMGLCLAGARAQDAGAADAGDGAGDGPAQQPKPDDKPPEKADPTDIRNSIGNLDFVRGFERMAAPQKPGLWSTLVDQPYFPPPVKAAKNLFHGQYQKAEALYAALLKDTPDNQEYIENQLEAILDQGRELDVTRFVTRYDALNAGQKSTAKLTRLRAQAYVAAGKSEDGRALLKTFVENHPKIDLNDGELLNVYVNYGELLERDAQYTAAAGVYAQITAAVEGKLPTDSQAATQVAIAEYRGSRLTGDVETRQRDAMNQLARVRDEDQTYWPAYLVEAEILAAAHNDQQTGQAVAQVLDLNPNELETRFLSVDHSISQYDFDGAQKNLDDLKGKTDLADVSAYEGRLWLKEREPEKAVAPLLEAIRKDPRLAEARGWLAGAYFLLNEPQKMNEQLSAIKVGDNGKHPEVLFDAAEILKDARQFQAAELLYLEARKGAPWWSEPPAALSELYMDMGEEDKAKAAYETSYKMDPYNMRAVNQIKLLEILQKFATKESKTRLTPGSDQPAFIVKYDPKDEMLATLAIQWMEKVRPELWSYFKITSLPAPTIIEFFPSHEEFGVRTTGLPWIGTVGASTGNVIALDVPRVEANGQGGTFDWARVLRHEYTHTVTLAMTNNRIPHWLTEAAAVEQEQSPRDWDNCQLLCQNYRAGTLFKIADLNWGFIKPKRTIDRQLAYFESQWIYDYLVETYGQPKMLDFLQCFHDGLTEPAAWKKTYGKTMDQMDTEFRAWAGKQIESWGLPSDPLPKREEVDAALAKNPDDPDALYNRAWLKVSAGTGQDLPGARADLEKVIALKPGHVKARELLGGVLYSLNEKPKAKEMLEGVVADDPNRPVALRTLGLLAVSAKDYPDAEKWLTKLQQVRPLEQTSYSLLAGIYLAQKQDDKAIGQLLELERHEQKDERIPRKLADLYQAAGKLPEAEAAAFRAIRINPFNALNHQELAQVLMLEKKPADAVEYWQDAAALQPKIAEFWEGLANAKGDSGDAAGASEAAKKAVELQANSTAKKWIKE